MVVGLLLNPFTEAGQWGSEELRGPVMCLPPAAPGTAHRAAVTAAVIGAVEIPVDLSTVPL